MSDYYVDESGEEEEEEGAAGYYVEDLGPDGLDDDNGEWDEALEAKLEEAMRLNEQLRALAAQEGGGGRGGGGGSNGQTSRGYSGSSRSRGRGATGRDSSSGRPRVKLTGAVAAGRSHTRRVGGASSARGRGGAGGAASAARRPPRSNFTFDESRTNQITASNQHLLNRLSNIAVRDVRRMTQAERLKKGRAKHRSSNGINRSKKQSAIEKQNAAFAKRLASIKSSKDISRKNLKKHSKKHERIAANVRQYRSTGFAQRPSSRQQRPTGSSRLRDAVASAAMYDHLF
eukprot:INCI18144.1.p1 GENE.INCI18144.1~~INCI18144.1.p1  ORF type:complete len:287 (+),score=50.60 INCI18144.1:42-902(+)